MATIKDVDSVLRIISRNIRMAEHEMDKAMQINGQLSESIQSLDNLRRNMVFVNEDHVDIVTLTSLILEIERTKKLLEISKLKIKQPLVVAVAHVTSLYHYHYSHGELGPLVRLGNYIRQIASILRYTRDLINDYSELLSMTVLLESEIILNSTIKSSSESYFFQQLKTLNSSWV